MMPTRKKKATKKAARKRTTTRSRPKAKAKKHGSSRGAARRKSRPARKSARKSARKPARRTARRATIRKVVRREAGARKGTPARGAGRSTGRTTARAKERPSLSVVGAPRPVRRARASTPTPAPFPQRSSASPKQLVLFEMIRARTALLSAIQGLSPGSANEPMGEGRWSVRETVLHLITRDQARLRESEPALHGQEPSWKGIEDPAMGVLNAELMAPLRHLDWEDALRTLHRVREQLMEEIESVPEEPADVWSRAHPFGWMLHALPPHDRHHADSIKRWRLERTL